MTGRDSLKTLLATIAALLLLSLACGSALAAIYKWVDENGTVTFRDTPPPEGTQTQVVDPGPLNVIAGPQIRNSGSQNDEKPIAALGNPRVELYSTSWCPYCKKAANFFRARGIPFVEYDIEKDSQAARRKQQLDSRRGVPFAVINGVGVSGFSERAYLNALNARP